METEMGWGWGTEGHDGTGIGSELGAGMRHLLWQPLPRISHQCAMALGVCCPTPGASLGVAKPWLPRAASSEPRQSERWKQHRVCPDVPCFIEVLPPAPPASPHPTQSQDGGG